MTTLISALGVTVTTSWSLRRVPCSPVSRIWILMSPSAAVPRILQGRLVAWSMTRVAASRDAGAGALAEDDDAARVRHPYDKTHLRRLAWMGLRTLCRRPQDQVARATGLPSEIVEEVVSVYLGADILFDAATGDNVGRRGSSAGVTKGMCVVS